MTESTANHDLRFADYEPILQTDVNGPAWDQVVCSLGGNFMHSFAWSGYISTSLGKPLFFTVNRAGGTVAAGWYTLSGKRVGTRIIMKQVQMETLPCFDPEKVKPREVFHAVQKLAAREKCVAFSFGNSEPEYAGLLADCHVAEKISFSIDLTDPIETICARFHAQHRKRIRRAVRSGLRVEAFTGDAPAWVDSLDAMYQYTHDKHVSTGKNRNQPKEHCIRDAVSCLVTPGHAVLFAALLGNEPVSFNIVSVFNGKAQGIFQASSEKGYALSASYLLNRQKIEYFKERGYRSFSIGEVPRGAENSADPDHGLYLYKSGYAGKTKIMCSGSLVLRRAAHAAFSMIKRGKSAAQRVRGLVIGSGADDGHRTD